MRNVGVVGFALVAALALSAMTASSALALPVLCLPTVEKEWGNFNEGCGTEGAKQGFVRGMILAEGDKVGEGEYCLMVLPGFRTNVKGWTNLEGCRKNEAGTVVATGAVFTRVKDKVAEDKGGTAKSEFKKLPTGKKLAGFIGESTLKVANESISCEKGSDGGEITGMDSIGRMVITFSGCVAHNEKEESCAIKSPGAAEGQIITNTLRGLLGTVKSSEAPSEVAVLIEPESSKRITFLASTKCSVESSVVGTVAAEVNPVDSEVSDGEFAIELSSGKQAITQVSVLSGTKRPELEAYGLEASEQAIDEIEFENPVEID